MFDFINVTLKSWVWNILCPKWMWILLAIFIKCWHFHSLSTLFSLPWLIFLLVSKSEFTSGSYDLVLTLWKCSWEADSISPSLEIPLLLWNAKVRYHVNPIHVVTSYLFEKLCRCVGHVNTTEYCPQITSRSPQGIRVFRQCKVPRA
jgi:hypothetical protein